MTCSCYILKCGDGSYYIGSTRDIDARLRQHQRGQVRTTAKRLPVQLLYREVFKEYGSACRREKQLKGWKSRSALERLMQNNPAPSSNG